MKMTVVLATIATSLALSAPRANAQEFSTNLLQNLNIKLTAYYQMEPSTSGNSIMRNVGKASISNKDIIGLLGLQLKVVFSSDAKLMIESKLGDDEEPQIIVRDTVGGEEVDTYVDEFFHLTVLGSVRKTKTNTQSYKTSGTGYDALQFSMELDQATFDVQGFVKSSISPVEYNGMHVGEAHSGTLHVSGVGEYAASPAGGTVPVVLDGTVGVSGKEIEVEQEE